MDKILYEVKDGIGWIRFNDPEILNAVNSESLQLFVDTLRAAAEDDEVKAIILGSVGEAFCVGEDLKRAMEEYPQIKSGDLSPILHIVEDVTENLQEIPRIIRSARKVVIAAVHRYAVGGGCEIALDADMIVAADDAVFGFPETYCGMTVTGGATKLLPMMVGLSKARELMLTGEFIDAAEAHRIGLVNKVVPRGEEEAEAERLARLVMCRGPLATIAHKRMLQNAAEASFETALEIEKQTITPLIYSEDYGEAITAFAEKRSPKFQGR